MEIRLVADPLTFAFPDAALIRASFSLSCQEAATLLSSVTPCDPAWTRDTAHTSVYRGHRCDECSERDPSVSFVEGAELCAYVREGRAP